MAEYKGIFGTKIQNYTSDPANPITGQVWYNETSQTMKFQYPTTIGAWATGTSINTARRASGGTGTYTSALMFGGFSTADTNITESWNGSAWTEVGDLNTSRNNLTGAGADNTSALGAGGYSPPTLYTGITESWNGTAWTEVADLNTARSALGGTGTQTAAIVAGGNTPPNFSDTKTESWNGTSWTEVNDLNTARESVTSANTGTQTAALFAGGQQGNPPPNFSSALVESWDGTSWTEVGDLNTARENVGNSGTQTSAIVSGGSAPSYTGITESWDGTSWTEVGDLNTARGFFTSPGSSSNALAVAGYSGTANLSATEEWNTGIPIGAWSTGGSLNQARSDLFGSNGTQTAALTVGGYIQPTGTYIANTEAYDGSAWTEVNDLNVAKSSGVLSGIQTSGLYTGGDSGPVSNLTTNESWNGTSWTEVGDLNTGRRYLGGTAADNTAALVFAGFTPGPTANVVTESWNGTSWTEVNDLNTARWTLGGLGVSTSALATGGYTGTVRTGATESWNGTSWTEVNDLNTARSSLAASGTISSGIAFGGSTPAYTGATEIWNGTSWAEDGDLSTGRDELQGAGASSSSALASGGGQPDTAATEEFTKPAFTTKTITSS